MVSAQNGNSMQLCQMNVKCCNNEGINGYLTYKALGGLLELLVRWA